MATMPTDEYAIAIVVDSDFGDRLVRLAERLPVWIVDSPTNREAAQQVESQGAFPDRGVVPLRGLRTEPREKTCASFLRVVLNTDEVIAHDPPPSTIEVYGARLTATLRQAFEADAFAFFDEMDDGFIARSRRIPGPRTKGLPRPFGLAFSGGGFRATAFHLGVLKRLRELGVLQDVDFVSTVSGGSIAGAHWVNWQAHRDTIHDDAEWDKFESSLIRFMMLGARQWVVRYGFWLPVALLLGLGLVVYVASSPQVWPPNAVSAWSVGASLAVIGALAYTAWHYYGARLYQRLLNRELFNGATLNDLSATDTSPSSSQESATPFLIVNATGLNSGDHLLFVPQPAIGSPGRKLLSRVLPETSGVPPTRKKRRRTQHRDIPPRVTLELTTPLARAVAASCALPGVFAPLSIPDPEPSWETPSWWSGRFVAVDGGVKDNQGTQVLLDGHCRGAVVSDAAAALRTVARPGTWQLFPPGKGVVFRSQSIVYERMRDLGYQLLEERYELSCRLEEAGLHAAAEAAGVALLDGYSYVELWPSDEFRWQAGARMPDELVPYLASMRTDLDRFSATEISALMFHGYTLIDHCLRAYHPLWISEGRPPLKFVSPVKEVIIDWSEIPAFEKARYASHFSMSHSRLGWYRGVRRRWIWRNARKRLLRMPTSERCE